MASAPSTSADTPADEPTRAPKGGPGAFLRNCWQELRRVQWPDRTQVAQASAVTIGFCVVAGALLGVADAAFKPLMEAIL